MQRTKSALFNAGTTAQNRTARTENGALTLKSTQDSVLDLFSQGGAVRSRSDAEIQKLFANAYASDRDLAMKVIFYLRDIRGGQGERKVFRQALQWLAANYPDSIRKNFKFIADMGRWDDFFELRGTPVEKDAFAFLQKQWRADIAGLKEGADSISLLGKWAPSENASSRETRRDAEAFITFLGTTPRLYRKTLSNLRAKINVLERTMSSRNWTAIDYSHVPSRASLIYRKAFGKRDSERYGAYLKALVRGDADVKVNASTLYPYDLIRSIFSERSAGSQGSVLMDQQWKALPNYIPEDDESDTLVVVDTSSSMNHGPIFSSVGIGLYFAERNRGLFENCFITFEAEPQMLRVTGQNLYEKAHAVREASWGGNTNLQAVFDLILKLAVQNGLPESEMPHKIFIVSDMEFDRACPDMRGARTNFEAIEAKYRAAGYARPTLVFWNVDARGKQSPVEFDEVGTMLVSGQSPSIFKSVMESKTVTPYDLMIDTVSKPRYAGVLA